MDARTNRADSQVTEVKKMAIELPAKSHVGTRCPHLPAERKRGWREVMSPNPAGRRTLTSETRNN